MKKITFWMIILGLMLIQPAYGEKNTQFTMLDGTEGDLNEGYTDYILVDFMATWCLPCQLSMPSLNNILETTLGVVDIISISMDVNDTLNGLQEFYDDYNGNWDFGWDQDGKLNDTYPIHYYPTTVIMDSNRTIVKEWIGKLDQEDEGIILKELDNYVDLPGEFFRNLDFPVVWSTPLLIMIIYRKLGLNTEK